MHRFASHPLNFAPLFKATKVRHEAGCATLTAAIPAVHCSLITTLPWPHAPNPAVYTRILKDTRGTEPCESKFRNSKACVHTEGIHATSDSPRRRYIYKINESFRLLWRSLVRTQCDLNQTSLILTEKGLLHGGGFRPYSALSALLVFC